MNMSKVHQNSKIKAENLKIEHEIECPRCNDMMTLSSDFDQFYYSCEACNFCLYTFKRNF